MSTLPAACGSCAVPWPHYRYRQHGPVNPPDGYCTNVLVVTGLVTRFAVVVPIASTGAPESAEAFRRPWVAYGGPPQRLLSDHGSTFAADVCRAMCNALSMKKVHTTTHHAQSNGHVERNNRTLKDMLSTMIDTWTWAWCAVLPYCQWLTTRLYTAPPLSCRSRRSRATRIIHRRSSLNKSSAAPRSLDGIKSRLQRTDAAIRHGHAKQIQRTVTANEAKPPLPLSLPGDKVRKHANYDRGVCQKTERPWIPGLEAVHRHPI